MANVTYAQLSEATDVQDTDLLATFRGAGPLKRLQASVLKAYMGGDALLIDGSNAMTAPIQAYAGSEGSPGLGASGDTDTGFYWPSANTLALATGGLRRGQWDSTGYTATFPINYGSIVDVASASTCNIGAATSNFVRITGTTTITAFDSVAVGVVRYVRFAGSLTLTHNGTTLILPGGANIVTAAGDTMSAQSEGSGNWRVVSYTRAALSPSDVATLSTQQTFTARKIFTILNLGAAVSATIASGAITFSASNMVVAAEGGGPTDNLDTINGGADNDTLILRGTDSQTITVRSVGNIRVNSGGSLVLDSGNDTLSLLNTGGTWLGVAQGNN